MEGEIEGLSVVVHFLHFLKQNMFHEFSEWVAPCHAAMNRDTMTEGQVTF